MAYYITHVIKHSLPKNGLMKVGFYTKDSENSSAGEYFLGTDNNPFKSDEIEELILLKKIIRVPEAIKIENRDTLYVDSEGCYFLADYLNSSVKKRSVLNSSFKTTHAPMFEYKPVFDIISKPEYLTFKKSVNAQRNNPYV